MISPVLLKWTFSFLYFLFYFSLFTMISNFRLSFLFLFIKFNFLLCSCLALVISSLLFRLYCFALFLVSFPFLLDLILHRRWSSFSCVFVFVCVRFSVWVCFIFYTLDFSCLPFTFVLIICLDYFAFCFFFLRMSRFPFADCFNSTNKRSALFSFPFAILPVIIMHLTN